MYDYISGNIAELTPTKLILDNNGIGYQIIISLQTFSKLEDIKDNAKVFVYHLVKEDIEALYGFADKGERAVFTQLISVSGIGPNTACIMLSSLSVDEIKTAILTGDVNKIKSVKGIGLKTAQRTILELKDKIGKTSTDASELLKTNPNSEIEEEAKSALILLGFNKSNVEKVISKVLKEDQKCKLEDLIKRSLKLL